MKRILLFAIIGWMSVVALRAQVVGFNGGYAFEMNHGIHPSRVNCSIDYMENHGVFGLSMAFPSGYDDRFEFGLHGGIGFYWDNFMLSPLFEIAYNTAGSESLKIKGISVGAGLLVEYKIVGPLGVWTKFRWLSPVEFDPVSLGPGGTTTFAVGLTMYWFR